ncbi:putative basic proline-rich protein-like [Iris pallida]|uniref:Basic proline-rich protein-like n=1 Tax=Iris pallida TaxID=29817 RepID=A0AAX6I2J4_IRIPA|nr:putative basic proline-rich protein-like [Iris pallida]
MCCWVDFGYPEYFGKVLWLEIISVVIFSGLLFGWNNCRFCGAFPSFGLSRNRGNAVQIFTKTLFIWISNWFLENELKTDFRATTVPICGP